MNVQELVNDTKLMLGSSVVDLEVSDDDITRLANKAFKTIKPFVADRKLITIPVQNCIDLTEYKVLDVIRVFHGNNVLSNCGDEVYFDFQKYSKANNSRMINRINHGIVTDNGIDFLFDDGKLYLENYQFYDNVVTIEAITDVDILTLQDERAIAWIEKYTLALTKEVVGRIRSKYKSSNLPIEMDGDTLLNEAQTERQTLESELTDKDFGQFFILR